MKTGQRIGIKQVLALLQNLRLCLVFGQRKYYSRGDQQNEHQHHQQADNDHHQFSTLFIAQGGNTLQTGILHVLESDQCEGLVDNGGKFWLLAIDTEIDE